MKTVEGVGTPADCAAGIGVPILWAGKRARVDAMAGDP
jgi:hypothetical protein